MKRAAIVTGATGGIGEAIVKRLVADGCHVIATDIREDGASVLPGDVDYVRLDLLNTPDVSPIFDRLGARHLDYLVNAAGVALFDRDGSVLDIRDNVWEKTLGVNLHGLRRMLIGAVPRLRKGRGKSIVNIASIAGTRGMDSPLDAYQISKAAVVSLSRSLALQLGPERIRCNAVCPGAILTPMIAGLYEHSPDRRIAMEQRTPLRRLGGPEEIASAVAFLLSDDASFVTATELIVDGGWSAQIK